MARFIPAGFQRAETCFWKKPKLVSAQMEDRVKNKIIRAMHVHDDRVEIVLVRNGHGCNTVGGRMYEVQGGDILIYNAGVVHDEHTDTVDGMDIMWCTVTDIQIETEPENVLIPLRFAPVLPQAECFAEAEALMTMLMTEHSEELRHHLLCALLLLLREEAMRRPDFREDNGSQLSFCIQQYIDEHYLEDICLEDIAVHLGKSAEYLSRTFRRATGYAPMQYVTRRRIGEAQSWLLMSDKTVTEIAFLVGYNSVGTFHTAFRKTVGMTPQKYREHWPDHPKQKG